MRGQGFGVKQACAKQTAKPEFIDWKIDLVEGNVLDFAGDSILAYVQIGYRLKAQMKMWSGWVTYASDTLDGFSFTFGNIPEKEAASFLRVKNAVREHMGRELEHKLAAIGVSPQPRPNVKRTGNFNVDFKVSAFAPKDYNANA